jgi:hypothetical protein
MCTIPVSQRLHVELGTERCRPDRTALAPVPAVLVQVCPLTRPGLVVVGVASTSERLHSVTVVESSTDVQVSALVGHRPGPKGADRLDSAPRRVLFVTEVTLAAPLGSRAVHLGRCPSPGVPEGDWLVRSTSSHR